MNEFQQQILQKIEQIALKLENYKTNNQELTKSKEELEAKVNYLERREQELKNQLEQKQMELSEKSEIIDKATNKIEDLLSITHYNKSIIFEGQNKINQAKWNLKKACEYGLNDACQELKKYE